MRVLCVVTLVVWDGWVVVPADRVVDRSVAVVSVGIGGGWGVEWWGLLRGGGEGAQEEPEVVEPGEEGARRFVELPGLVGGGEGGLGRWGCRGVGLGCGGGGGEAKAVAAPLCRRLRH